MDSLTTLRLYNNQLTGTIPASLGSLNKLTKLWLASDEPPYTNRLEGAVPEPWCKQGSRVGQNECHIKDANSLCLPLNCPSNWCGLTQHCPVENTTTTPIAIVGGVCGVILLLAVVTLLPCRRCKHKESVNTD